MKRIVAGIESKAAEIKTASEDIARGGYDIPAAVADLKKRFPLSYASGEETQARTRS
jgi:hypothetical protein